MGFLSTKSIASLSYQLTVGPSETYTTLQAAIAAATDGQNILVKAGTYAVASTITVNKKVKIVGENVDTVIFETAGTTSDPVSMFNVTVDDVAMAKMTIKHRKTSNTSVETAIVASGSAWPQPRIKNFTLEQCKIEYAEFGVTVRAEGWAVKDCTFTYATGTVGNSNRCIGIYGNAGNAFIKGNHFKNDVLNSTAFRPIYLTSTTGSNPNETVGGKLVIENNTHAGLLQQFFLQDNNQSAGVDAFELQIKNNVINETSVFAVFFAAAANAGNMFSSITLSGNTTSFLHGGSPIGGKGMFGVDGTAAFRSSPLILHESNNTFTNSTYRTDWGAVEGLLVGKANAAPAFTVSKDSVIPASGTLGSIFDATEVLSSVTAPASYTITSAMKAGTATFDLVLTKSELQSVAKVVASSTFNNDANWRIVGAIFKDPNSAKRVIAAFRDFDSTKAAKIRSEVAAGDVVQFHKLILSNSARELLVLDPSDL